MKSTTVAIVLAGLLILGGALFVRSSLQARADLAQATATAKAAQQAIAQKDADIATRDKASAAKDQQLAQQAAQIKSAQSAVQVITKYIPSPAAPVVIDRSALPTAVQQQVPDAPGPVVLLTTPQAEDIAKDELSCQATSNDLVTCKADLADRGTELATAQKESAAYASAAKGGSKWRRFGKVLKFAGCAGAGGAAGALLHKESGAAIGASAAVAACSTF